MLFLRLSRVWAVIGPDHAIGLAAAQDRDGTVPVAEATPIDPATAEKVQKSNGECLACHARSAQVNPPRADVDPEKLKRFLIDAPLFGNSNHGGVESKTCHGPGLVTFPHREGARQQTSQCSECHAQKVMRIEAQFDKSVHVTRQPGKFTCTTCHDPHKFEIAQKLGDPRQIVAQDNRMCEDCHRSDRPSTPLHRTKTELTSIVRTIGSLIHNCIGRPCDALNATRRYRQ